MCFIAALLQRKYIPIPYTVAQAWQDFFDVGHAGERQLDRCLFEERGRT